MKTLKILFSALLLSALLLAVSCRNTYYFPGGNPRKRVAPKDCGCPSYSLGENRTSGMEEGRFFECLHPDQFVYAYDPVVGEGAGFGKDGILLR